MPDLTCPDCKQPFTITHFQKSALNDAVNEARSVVNIAKASCGCSDALYMDDYACDTDKATLDSDFRDVLANLKPGDRARDRATQDAAYEAANPDA